MKTLSNLSESGKKLMEYLEKNHNPHAIAIVSSSSIEILEGVLVYNKEENGYKSPLLDPPNHNLDILLKELKYGRPAADQNLIDSFIKQLYNR